MFANRISLWQKHTSDVDGMVACRALSLASTRSKSSSAYCAASADPAAIRTSLARANHSHICFQRLDAFSGSRPAAGSNRCSLAVSTAISRENSGSWSWSRVGTAQSTMKPSTRPFLKRPWYAGAIPSAASAAKSASSTLRSIIPSAPNRRTSTGATPLEAGNVTRSSTFVMPPEIGLTSHAEAATESVSPTAARAMFTADFSLAMSSKAMSLSWEPPQRDRLKRHNATAASTTAPAAPAATSGRSLEVPAVAMS
mmetsp:Transcript_4673/g.10089  ORF Transcript_4673/g.10089 Transcript_4673/m.10089 type:complete len:255 (-) Transcript_4673:2-766(-)